jgi:hypothetical protein
MDTRLWIFFYRNFYWGKRQLVQNAQNIGMVDTVFEELESDKSFIETCDFP